MQKKHSHILEEIKSGYKDQARVSARHHLNKQEEWKSKLLLAKLKLEKETDNWKKQIHNLDIKLTTAKDKLYIEKMKRWQAIKEQFDGTERAVAIEKNYADSLEETNDDLRSKLKAAIAKKRAAFRLMRKAKKLATQRLDNWHEERNMWGIAQDKLAQQEKTVKQLELILEEYRSQLKLSNRNQCELKKEWAGKEA